MSRTWCGCCLFIVLYCRLEQIVCPCLGKFCSRRRNRFRASKLKTMLYQRLGKERETHHLKGIIENRKDGLALSSKLIDCHPSRKSNETPSFQGLRNAILHANAIQPCKRTGSVENGLTLTCFVGRSLVSYRPTDANSQLPAICEARAG